MKFFYQIEQASKKIILGAIRVYQRSLSPDTGWFKYKHPAGFCRFHPHCSEYAYQAVDKHGVLKGLLKSMWRLLRCHPWSKGGIDPV